MIRGLGLCCLTEMSMPIVRSPSLERLFKIIGGGLLSLKIQMLFATKVLMSCQIYGTLKYMSACTYKDQRSELDRVL